MTIVDGKADSSQTLIDARSLSSLQVTLFVICFLVATLDGFDVALIGFLTPALAKAFVL